MDIRNKFYFSPTLLAVIIIVLSITVCTHNLEVIFVKLNEKAIALIKSFEGLELKAYKDAVGVWTIGYGHTSMAGEPKVVPGMTITEAEAVEILKTDLVRYECGVKAKLAGLTDNEYGACVSLCYNIGPGAFQKSSIVKLINEGNKQGAADAFLLWNKAGGKTLKGLVRRRQAERALFLSKN